MNEEHLIFGMRAVIEAVEAGKEIEKTFSAAKQHHRQYGIRRIPNAIKKLHGRAKKNLFYSFPSVTNGSIFKLKLNFPENVLPEKCFMNHLKFCVLQRF